ncbi:WXG100 family type VII secretion target [Actinomycetes bacterium KLBMP 9797]
MPRIVYNFGALDSGAQTLEGTFGQLQSDIAALEAAVAPMLSVWDGEAMAAYTQLQEIWKKVGTDVGMVVRAVKDGVVEANEINQAGEARNVARFAT